MPTATVNGVRLFYQLAGDAGPPLALVHGGWGDHTGWDPIVPALAERFRVLAYDRRGHSQSERPPGPGSAGEDADDLAALLAHLGLAPAHVAGISFGGTIALWLATRHPAVVRSLAIHEPPLFDLVVDDPVHGAEARAVLGRIGAVADRLATGDMEGGAEEFFDTVAFGPGAWMTLPPEVRSMLVGNAPAYLDEARDPAGFTVDLGALAGCTLPALLTHGDRSAPYYLPVVARLATVLPQADVRLFAGAGHVPYVSHPDEYVAAITAFAETVDAAGAA